jgi:hypothetical protein
MKITCLWIGYDILRSECNYYCLCSHHDFGEVKMNDASISQLILAYVEGWKSGDREQILSTLDPACVIIESYSALYDLFVARFGGGETETFSN